jgi:hypothetical protein
LDRPSIHVLSLLGILRSEGLMLKVGLVNLSLLMTFLHIWTFRRVIFFSGPSVEIFGVWNNSSIPMKRLK